eukprot:Sspe_Gene.119278::Locus_114729_Transcript_1_1_Confidence_1.000_Length_661::g.119278::m.119278
MEVLSLSPLHAAALAGDGEGLESALRLAPLAVDSTTPPKWGHPTTRAQRLTALHLAASAGIAGAVRVLLHYGASVEAADNYANTALHYAASAAVAEELVKAGCGLECRNTLGYTPLHGAAMLRKSDVLNALVEAGADVEAQSWTLDTALHLAALRGPVSSVILLLQHDAPTHVRDYHGNTPLFRALAHSQHEVATALRNANAPLC